MLERIYWLLEIISLAICISSIYGVKIKADIKTVVWIAIEVTFMGMFKRNLITMQTYFIIYVLYILYVYIEFRMSLKNSNFYSNIKYDIYRIDSDDNCTSGVLHRRLL